MKKSYSVGIKYSYENHAPFHQAVIIWQNDLSLFLDLQQHARNLFAKWTRGEERLSINLYYASPLKWCGGDCRDFEVDFTPSGVWIVSFPHQVNQKQRKSKSKAFCFLWNIIDLLGLGSVSSSFLYIDVLVLPFFANWRLLLQQLNYVMRICEHNFCILVYVY